MGREYTTEEVLKSYRLEGETKEEYNIRRKNNKKILKLHKKFGYKSNKKKS